MAARMRKCKFNDVPCRPKSKEQGVDGYQQEYKITATYLNQQSSTSPKALHNGRISNANSHRSGRGETSE
nr:hypothetical protein [Tawny frogmouth aviadenovirus A]